MDACDPCAVARFAIGMACVTQLDQSSPTRIQVAQRDAAYPYLVALPETSRSSGHGISRLVYEHPRLYEWLLNPRSRNTDLAPQ